MTAAKSDDSSTTDPYDEEAAARNLPSGEPDPGAAWRRLANEIEPLLGYLSVVARNLVSGDRVPIERASDLVQMTVVAALENIAKGRSPENDATKLKSWLRGILIHLHSQSFRAKRPTAILAVDQLPDSSPSAHSEANRNELVRLMAQARARLPERDRQILDWKHEDKLTFEVIGQKFGISAVRAHKVHRRALKRLETEFLAVSARDAFERTCARFPSVL